MLTEAETKLELACECAACDGSATDGTSATAGGAMVELPILVAFPWKEVMDRDASFPEAGAASVEECDATMAAYAVTGTRASRKTA